MLSWLRRRREDRNASLDPGQTTVLARNVWQHRWLPPELRSRHHGVVARMIAERRWEGESGSQPNEETRLTIAGVAALLVVGLESEYAFERVPSIVVRPGAFSGAGETRLGEAWHRGPIVLSWTDSLRGARRPGVGPNVVLHEFAHHIDNLGGEMDGDPALPFGDAQRWRRTLDEEHARLVGQARRGELTLLDTYGATNRAEFFAVASECFLTRPHDLRARHGELFDLLRVLYQQNPAEWLPQYESDVVRRPRRLRRPARVELNHLGMTPSDAAYTRALVLLDQEHPQAALNSINDALVGDPNDAEALTLRAETRLMLQDNEGAAADAIRAAELDPSLAEAPCLAAEALIALGEDESAWPYAQRALRLDRDSYDANLWCGVLALGRGRPRLARKRLQTAVRVDKFDDEAHHWLAEALQRLGRPEQSEWHRRRAAVLAGRDHGERMESP